MDSDIPDSVLRVIYGPLYRGSRDVFSICAPTLEAAAEMASGYPLIQGDNWSWCKTCEHIAREGL